MNKLFSNMLRNYFIIFTVIILETSLFNPSHAFTFREIMLSALFSLAANLTSLAFYSKTELSVRHRYIRMVIHFVLLEAVILILGIILGQVSGIMQIAIFALEILGIYALVIIIAWLIDCKSANDINQRLASMRSDRK